MKINKLIKLTLILLLLFSGANTLCATNYRQVELLQNESVEAAFGTINYGPAAALINRNYPLRSTTNPSTQAGQFLRSQIF